jgi:hypothetical protein
MKRTARGFGVYSTFTDRDGSKITVVQSSADGRRGPMSFLRVYCQHPTEDVRLVPHLPDTWKKPEPMHLDMRQALLLRNALDRWIADTRALEAEYTRAADG